MQSTTPTPQRVMITDLGVVAASGVGAEAAWRCFVQKRSCIQPIQTFDTRAYPRALGAELLEFPLAGKPDDERSIHLLLAAADLLRPDLAELLHRESSAARRTAVVLGTSKGVVLGMAAVHRKVARGERMTAADISAVHAYRPGYGAERLARRLGVRGPVSTLALACASSSMALIQGAELIRRGVVDRAIVGGYDGFSPFIFAGFESIGALSTTTCRPFDRRRDGTVLGEGAALLLLESESSLRFRGLQAIAEYAGGGFAADGVHLTAPDREGRGLVRAIRQGLRDANLEATDVDYINAHGTATKFNDAMECRAFTTVFGDSAQRPPVSSSKSVFGHTLGAAGAFDAIVCVMAIQKSALPPTINGGEEPDEEGWDFVPNQVRPVAKLNCVLSTNSGFAGNNTALFFRRTGTSIGADPRSLSASDSSIPSYERAQARHCLGSDGPV